ncbi:MAG: DUF5131 family protein, partial [Clostridia bacterium]|nr:DUF5131 family protein [Clostridia bacterium]
MQYNEHKPHHGRRLTMRWNPWHGCRKLSEGCRNCYVYRMDAQHEKDAGEIKQNASTFRLPVMRNRLGEYKHPAGTEFSTCFTSDFFLEEADAWREDAWRMIRERSDCRFFIITKRIDRFMQCIPADWGSGYDHVSVFVTAENQKMADYRLPIYLTLPIQTKGIVCEPLLERIDLSAYLTPEITSVTVGGESGSEARICRYEWVLDIREQCRRAGVGFSYHQTGARLVKDGKLYQIPREHQHEQARRAGIDLGH